MESVEELIRTLRLDPYDARARVRAAVVLEFGTLNEDEASALTAAIEELKVWPPPVGGTILYCRARDETFWVVEVLEEIPPANAYISVKTKELLFTEHFTSRQSEAEIRETREEARSGKPLTIDTALVVSSPYYVGPPIGNLLSLEEILARDGVGLGGD